MLFSLVFIFYLLLAAGCTKTATQQTEDRNPESGNAVVAESRSESEKMVVVTGSGVLEETRMTMEELLELPDARCEHVYSTINNWPAAKKYAARGVKLTAVLEAAGLREEAKYIIIKGKDDFAWSFTRKQLLDTPRYYFPGVLSGDPAGAEPVEPLIACEYKENSDNLADARADDLCLILPQANVKEQTNHTFVKGVSEIRVAVEDPGKWDKASVFPPAGQIARGDTVKLQHRDLGKVKMYYTLDGSTPTEKSILYNSSTYQPELNKPIVIDKDTTIKVLVQGFGKYDSEIAEFRYQVK